MLVADWDGSFDKPAAVDSSEEPEVVTNEIRVCGSLACPLHVWNPLCRPMLEGSCASYVLSVGNDLQVRGLGCRARAWHVGVTKHCLRSVTRACSGN
jgi:hypothetical protein